MLASFAGVAVTIARKTASQEKLFGSVTAKDIEKGLADQGLVVDRKQIVLDEPIKQLGEFPVKIKLYSGIAADITVKVVEEAIKNGHRVSGIRHPEWKSCFRNELYATLSPS